MSENTVNSLEDRLRQVEREKTGSYEKRTDHLREDGSTLFINRLILEDSPYLLQHAHNPVNWFGWGAEPFDVAKQQGKPIFLSIGYSTCHWCHVMEVESFDNVEVARLLNQHFISIKLDREQYPDIDEFYMTGVQLMSGQGGWPMSNFLLSDGLPFFGATYFPSASFIQLLSQIVTAWSDRYVELENSANSIHAAIGRLLNPEKQRQTIAPQLRANCLQALYQREDRSLGGLTGAPKFPQEPILLLFLDQVVRDRDIAALDFLGRALQGMGLGGINDQVGGGFHRYSVDEEWLVPHFEKMLYNQSQLGLLYTEVFRVTGDEFYKRIANRTLDYVLRDMQSEHGAFFSATDADSEGAEGTFFLWTLDQLHDVSRPEDARLIAENFNVSEHGNFEGSNILHLSKPLEVLKGESGGDIVEQIDAILETLYESREQRPHPLRDDKIIVAWSAAMANTLVRCGHSLGRQDWLVAAERAVAMMMKNNVTSGGELQRIYLNGEVSIPAQLEDYGNLIQALLALFDVQGHLDYLLQANVLMQTTLSRFHNAATGEFYSGPSEQQGPRLIRSTNAGDGAILSPVGTVLNCLWDLQHRAALLPDPRLGLQYRQIREQCLSALAGEVNANPLSHTSLLRHHALVEQGSRETIQFGGEGRVRIAAAKNLNEASLTVTLRCVEGWHLTAPGSKSRGLMPIKLQLHAAEPWWNLNDVIYPPPQHFLRIPLPEAKTASKIANKMESAATPVYTGEIEIEALITAPVRGDELSHSIGIELEFQLCSEERCLLPETLHFVL